MKLKRLMMLVLCLALVCGLSVTAFAARTYSDREEYDGGLTWAESYAQISQYSTSGYVDAEGYNESSSTGVSCTYAYVSINGTRLYDEMQCNVPVRSSVNISFSSENIQNMRYAFYDFWAQVPSSSGWYDYEPDTVRLDY